MTGDTPYDVVVIGAGPAGIAAALGAHRRGARAVVIDEAFRPGGQYLRPHPPDPARHWLLEAARAVDLGFRLRSPVWHIDPARRCVVVGATGEVLGYRGLVLATGAHDRPVAVAGQELPGVYLAGGLQALCKDGARVGNRVLIAGTGPFLLPVACQALASPSRVIEISYTHLPRMFGALRHDPGVAGEAVGYALRLARRGVAVRSGWLVDRIVGTDRVEAVELRSRKEPSKRRIVQCDVVALGYGFLPQLALADIAGCGLRFNTTARTWFVDVPRGSQETTVPGVFACGEITGIGGHLKAIAEGSVAGAQAAQHAGFGTGATRDELRRADRLRRYATAIAPWITPPAESLRPDDDATVCRCEQVTAGQIRAAVDDGADTVQGVRMRTRSGMGPCQGRICGALVGEVVAARTARSLHTAGRIGARTPARPITVADIIS